MLTGVIGRILEGTDLKLPKQTGKVERDVDDSVKGCKQIKECASLSQNGSLVASLDEGMLDWTDNNWAKKA